MNESEYISLLQTVSTPGQYAGGEPNSIIKPDADFRVAMAFPDAYMVGMSHHGSRILYDIMNKIDGVQCERAFCPLPDMEQALLEKNFPLTTLETLAPLSECDLLAFSLSYELGITPLLTMLKLGNVEILSADRDGPLVIAGGHATFNPEPYADFIDAFVIGEGEEVVPEIISLMRSEKLSRAELLEKLSRLEGVYVPSLYNVKENADGFLVVEDGPTLPVKRRIIEDFENAPVPLKPVVPVSQTAHERVTLEIMRGCPHGCRFCQAGIICRPVRHASPEKLFNTACETYRNTGFDEVGLLSLSTSDYPHFDELVEKLDEHFSPLRVSLSLPSLRVSHALSGIPKRFKSVRKSGLTIAPEAGTDRLRASINKNITTEDLLTACEEAYSQGWNSIKLYFMIGLPGETDEDVAAIGHLSNKIAHLRKKGARASAVTCSVSNFVPKSHTPFQWVAMDSYDELVRKQKLIGENINRKRVSFKAHDVRISRLEGLLSRGDRKLGKVILKAFEAGARLDGWSEYFKPELWQDAIASQNIKWEDYTCARNSDDKLAWSHIAPGVSDEFLKRENANATNSVRTPSCGKDSCAACGVEGCGLK